jgi:hypothetical protein
MATIEELSARWDGFIQKLKDRFFEILKQSEEPLNEVINNLQYDTVILINIKTGLQNQTVNQLTQKASEGLNKMQAELEQIKSFSWGEKTKQMKKLDEFKEWLNVEFLKFETDLFAKAARKILENVKQHIDEKKMHRCTQCGAEFPIKIYSFMAINLKCDSCGSVNTYQPDDRIRALEWYVLNNLAEEYALPAKIQARHDPNAQKEYYRMYYGFLMENVPEKKEFYERDMNERLNNPMFSM